MAFPASAPHQSPAQAIAALLHDRSLGLHLANDGAVTEVGDPAALQVHLYDSRSGFRSIPERIWAAAEHGERGFLVCLLPPENDVSDQGLRRQLGIGHLAVSGMPGGRAYQLGDAAELDAIVRHGVRRMTDQRQDEFFYLTVEDGSHGGKPLSAADRDGAVHGIYLLRMGQCTARRRVQLLGGDGCIDAVLEAAKVLEAQYSIDSDIWYVTSYQELARNGMRTASSTLGSQAADADNWFARQMAKTSGPIIAVSGYSRVLPEMIRPLVSYSRRFRTMTTETGGKVGLELFRPSCRKLNVDTIVRAARDDVGAENAEERVREERRFAAIISMACI